MATVRRFKADLHRLEEELERLKKESGIGHELVVMWTPNSTSDRHGEVKGSMIYIYDERVERALQTLKHEFIDHLITSRIVKPLVGLVNLLIKSRGPD